MIVETCAFDAIDREKVPALRSLVAVGVIADCLDACRVPNLNGRSSIQQPTIN